MVGLAAAGVGPVFGPLNAAALGGLPLVTAACFLLASTRRALGGSVFWIVLAGGMVMGAVSGALLSAQVLMGGAGAHPTVPIQLARLAAAALVLAGVLIGPLGGLSRLNRARLALEGGVSAAAIFCLLWSAGIGPGAGGAVLSVVYPVVDAVVLALVLQALAAATSNRLALAVWTAGIALMLVTNTGVAAATTASAPLASWVYPGWAFAFLCLSLGAVSAAPGSPVGAAPGRKQVVLPYAAALVACAAAYARLLVTRAGMDPVLLTAGFALVLLLFVRQWVLWQENLALLSKEHELRVAQRFWAGFELHRTAVDVREAAEAGAGAAAVSEEAAAARTPAPIAVGEFVRVDGDPDVWLIQRIEDGEARLLPVSPSGVPRAEIVASLDRLQRAGVDALQQGSG